MNTYKIDQEAQVTALRIEKARSFLAEAPEGRLERFRKKDKYYYYISTYKDGKRLRKYIADSEQELILLYARKEYYERLLPRLERNMKALNCLLTKYDPNPENTVLSTLPDWVAEIVRNNSSSSNNAFIKEWETAEYNQNPFRAEDRNLETLKGDFVRSKGEREIANALYRKGIPYRTDCEVKLNDGTIYADFVILHPKTCKLYYWEHSGKLGESSYVRSNYDRISRYAEAGILPGEKLIMTGENSAHILKTQTIERIIDTFFGD